MMRNLPLSFITIALLSTTLSAPPARAQWNNLHALSEAVAASTQPESADETSLPAALQQALSHMQASAQLLAQDDPGKITQDHQQKVVQGLDELIALARQQQQSSSSSSGQSKPQPGQKLQKNQPGSAAQGSKHGEQGTTAAQQSSLPGGSPDAAQPNNIHEKAEEWGNLPPRERDLIVHGSKEHALPSYQDLVNKYYQALAELGRSDQEKQQP